MFIGEVQMSESTELLTAEKNTGLGTGGKYGINDNDRGEYLKTPEAAEYLRKSTSWLLHQADVPYLSGNPNIYKRKDLDAWFERHKVRPRVGV